MEDGIRLSPVKATLPGKTSRRYPLNFLQEVDPPPWGVYRAPTGLALSPSSNNNNEQTDLWGDALAG